MSVGYNVECDCCIVLNGPQFGFRLVGRVDPRLGLVKPAEETGPTAAGSDRKYQPDSLQIPVIFGIV